MKPMVEEEKRKEEVKLGDFIHLGRYSMLVALFCELSILIQLSNMLFMMFAGAAPVVVSCGDHDFSHFLHITREGCEELSRLRQNGSSCQVELDYQFNSVNVKWDYYCEHTSIVKHSTSIQMIGVMVGAMVLGQVSDIFGRKKAMLLSFVGCIVFMAASSFAQNLVVFTVARFVVNVFNGGIIAVTLVYSVENLPKKDRLWINSIVSWAPNYLIYSGVAYLVQDWRKLAQCSAALAILPVILLCYMPESVQYLSHKNKIDEASRVIQWICKVDGRKCDTALLKQVLNKEKNEFETKQASKKYSYHHLFSTWTLARYTAAVCLSSFVTSVVNYGLVFNMEKLSGSIYMNGVFVGLLRWAVNLTVAFMDFNYQWMGRKRVHLVAWIGAISASFTVMTLYALELEHEYKTLVRVCLVSIVSVAAQLYLSCGIATSELFPTCVRSLASSFGQLHSRIGVVLAPQLFLAQQYWSPLPYLVMGCIGFVDMLFFEFALPETKGRPLVEEMPSRKARAPLQIKKLDEETEKLAPV